MLYDADDMVDELDYYRLQHQVEGGTVDCADEPQGTDGDGAEQVDGWEDSADLPSSSSGKKGSKYWKEFSIAELVRGKPVKVQCIHCHTEVQCASGKRTSVLKNHLASEICKNKREASNEHRRPASAGNGNTNSFPFGVGNSNSRKRMRRDEVSTHNTMANAHHFTTKFSTRIHQMALQLQDIRGAVAEFLKDSAAGLKQYQCNTSYPRFRTSSLVAREVYGREAEKDKIIRVMTADESEAITVLPIVGIAGVGKTAIAQLVYNNPIVESQFERIWVWVSENFDEVILTKEMLDFVSEESHENFPEENESFQKKERHERMGSYAKLQEMLKGHMKYRSKRFLLILDDVWDSMDNYRWNKLLAPLKSSHTKGNVIVVTTRNLSVAQRIGTVEPVKLGALKNDDIWLLCKAFAFGDENYERYPTLNIIGQQIVEKLKGNPLAAVSAGTILRDYLTIEHWSSIVKNEEWKSLQLSGGIMSSLKHSYDQLPYHLQQCFLYCSIFPNNYKFPPEDLVRIWISQGFVRCFNSNRIPEEIGWGYLTDLMNLGFFEQVEEPTSGNQTRYVMCGIMHDFARLVSRTEYATIDGSQFNEMLPTIRYLSIVTDVDIGKILHREKFQEKLQRVVTSVRKLRTLVLIGKNDSLVFLSLQDILQKAQCLRMLQISAAYAGFNYFMCKLVNSTHLRYLKLENNRSGEALPIPLSKFYHLEILDVAHAAMIPKDINGLVSIRHLVVQQGARPSVTGTDEMSYPKKLHNSTDQHSGWFEIRQLQPMNELVQLGVLRLENVSSAEARGAKLRDKIHLENLFLSWKDTNNSTNSRHFTDATKEVLEGLEPHHNLKHLKISGYSGAGSPAWLATSVTRLQTLRLKDCGGWQILPSLERLPFLTKLELMNMREVVGVSIPSLEELALIQMPKLERCSCSSVKDLNSSLRILIIEGCDVLKGFPLFESCDKLKIEQKSWLSHLNELTIYSCPHLMVSNPLPPSTTISKLFIAGGSTVPAMKGSSSETFEIGPPCGFSDYFSAEELRMLDDRILAFHNLRILSHLIIQNCKNLTSISFESFRPLVNLKRLELYFCEKLFSSDVLLEDTHIDMLAADFKALPSLKHLTIKSCGIAGKWLSVLLRHAQGLEELHLEDCMQITWLSTEEENSPLSPISAPEASSPGNSYDGLPSSALDGLLRIPSNAISSLKKVSIRNCDVGTSEDAFARFTSLEELAIWDCPELIWSLVRNDESDNQANGRWLLPQSLGKLYINESTETLQLCYPGNLTCLKKLEVGHSPGLRYLQLQTCTALEELTIQGCASLVALEGLRSLRRLKVCEWPGFIHCLERLAGQGYDMRPGLESLEIADYSTTSFCIHLTSLQRLELVTGWSKETRLTDQQEISLQLLTSLQDLRFGYSANLTDIPVGLHNLRSLKRLEINSCWRIARLPERGLPPSLEELDVSRCSKELTEQCRVRATRKLKVKIDGRYVN